MTLHCSESLSMRQEWRSCKSNSIFIMWLYRYTPSLSRRCTHLVVSLDSDAATSRKLALALHNKDKWHTHIVTPAWITSCSQSSTRLEEQDFAAPDTHVRPMAFETEAQTLRENATCTSSGARKPAPTPPRSTAKASKVRLHSALHGCHFLMNSGIFLLVSQFVCVRYCYQVASSGPSAAKTHQRRQPLRRLSRFAPCGAVANQENEALLQQQQQQRKERRSSQAATQRRHPSINAAAPESLLTVEVQAACVS